MKRLVAAVAVAAAVVGMAMAAGAATDVTNWATSTYQLTGGSVTPSNQDSAVVRVQGAPVITVQKLATNVRTGITADYQVSAVTGDQINFTIIWANTGEATAETVVLSDYIPTANLTYVAASVSDTAVNVGGNASSEVGGLVSAVITAAAGTDPGAAANGIVKFSTTVN